MVDPAVVLASLNNPSHGWIVRGRHTHSHTEHRPTVSGDVMTVDEVAHEMRTYQLKSDTLDLHIVMIAELEGGMMESLFVIYQGSNIDITSAPILAKLDAMADSSIEAAQSELTARLES